jgi:hypothetical protein
LAIAETCWAMNSEYALFRGGTWNEDGYFNAGGYVGFATTELRLIIKM